MKAVMFPEPGKTDELKADVLSRKAQEIAERVMRQEGNALLNFADNLPDHFDDVVELILKCRGRVVVSGMGKSGHIAHKIAATLASTGTPSFFVHPAEASHGDLGMVTEHDVVVAISNSGETTELRDLLTHAKRFAIPLIGISKRPESTLMTAADYQLPLPDVAEACSIGMAPTTSTTMTLALGDALAIALMETRGFIADNFRLFHPGGKLGAQLAIVRDLMHAGRAMPVVSSDTPMAEALITMSSKGFGIVAVVDSGELKGVVTDGDLRRNVENLTQLTAGEVASNSPITIESGSLASEALRLMNEHKITALFVVSTDQHVEGLLTIHDCLRAGVV